jgi:hypothetical protein
MPVYRDTLFTLVFVELQNALFAVLHSFFTISIYLKYKYNVENESTTNIQFYIESLEGGGTYNAPISSHYISPNCRMVY